MSIEIRKYAFPEAVLVRHSADGIRHLVGVRYRWNTGETQIAWCQDMPAALDALDEEAIPGGTCMLPACAGSSARGPGGS